jgi:hypothetical protein
MMKKADKKAKSARKDGGKKQPLSATAVRDLELMNPDARRVEGGARGLKRPKR